MITCVFFVLSLGQRYCSNDIKIFVRNCVLRSRIFSGDKKPCRAQIFFPFFRKSEFLKTYESFIGLLTCWEQTHWTSERIDSSAVHQVSGKLSNEPKCQLNKNAMNFFVSRCMLWLPRVFRGVQRTNNSF